MNKDALKVVPDGWAARHRPVVAGFFKDTVRLERPVDSKTGDEFGGKRRTGWELLDTDVDALVQIKASLVGADLNSAGVPLVITDYLMRVGIETVQLRDKDRVTVLTSDDPSQVGLELIVHIDESQTFAVDGSYHLQRVQNKATEQEQ